MTKVGCARALLLHWKGVELVDIYRDPMLNIADTATYLAIPESTVGFWRRNGVVHSVKSEQRGWPVFPFAAVVETFVLRGLRKVGFTQRQIREAAEGIRREFNDPYGLIRPNIGHDGVEIFMEIGGAYVRAKDRQHAIRETILEFTYCIEWDGQDPQRLRLPNFQNVILDPRFGWGRPVVASNKVPVEAIRGLWLGGESFETIGEEFGMSPNDVIAVLRDWDRAREQAAA